MNLNFQDINMRRKDLLMSSSSISESKKPLTNDAIEHSKKLSIDSNPLDEVKPLLRGKFHLLGFFIFLALGVYGVYIARNYYSAITFIIYLMSTLILYATSSIFHLNDWKTVRTYRIMQRLDHASIYLQIAGTYTPVCTDCLPADKSSWPWWTLAIAWTIAIAGIIKSVFWVHAPKMVNVIFYFICGLVILPAIPLAFNVVELWKLLMFMIGGACYLTGGMIYGLETPDPIPLVFGYHEIFHVLTLLANGCFLIPILYCISH